jgi:hypothetical protein
MKKFKGSYTVTITEVEDPDVGPNNNADVNIAAPDEEG